MGKMKQRRKLGARYNPLGQENSKANENGSEMTFASVLNNSSQPVRGGLKVVEDNVSFIIYFKAMR